MKNFHKLQLAALFSIAGGANSGFASACCWVIVAVVAFDVVARELADIVIRYEEMKDSEK